MTRIDPYAEYARKLKEKRDSVVEAMANGQVKDYAGYRQLCGLLQGLEFAQNVMDDLAKRLNEDADDE